MHSQWPFQEEPPGKVAQETVAMATTRSGQARVPVWPVLSTCGRTALSPAAGTTWKGWGSISSPRANDQQRRQPGPGRQHESASEGVNRC